MFFLSCNSNFAQIAYTLEQAQAMALSQNKLIVMDFTANWCEPCRKMEVQLWDSKEFQSLSDRFILLKLDMDQNQILATRYGVTDIPRVIVITANEDKLWDQTGFRTPDYHLKALSAFPSSFEALNISLMPVIGKKSTDAEQKMRIGSEFQILALHTSNSNLKQTFFRKSDAYFSKALKYAPNEDYVTEAKLAIILNSVYKGKHKKALKQINKMEINSQSERIEELKNFIFAFCYKCEGDEQQMNTYKAKIRNQNMLARLD